MLERSKGCHNNGIVRSLQEVIKRPLKDIIFMRGFWLFIIHVPGMWHMARSPSGTLPGIICWSVPVTLPQVLSEIRLMPSNNHKYIANKSSDETLNFGYLCILMYDNVRIISHARVCLLFICSKYCITRQYVYKLCFEFEVEENRYGRSDK